MAECKDCIHDKVCPIWDYYNDCFEERNADTCKNYLPTADVVEVVRCRDCEKRIGESITGKTFCLAQEVSVPYDYYCASGKRRKTDER